MPPLQDNRVLVSTEGLVGAGQNAEPYLKTERDAWDWKSEERQHTVNSWCQHPKIGLRKRVKQGLSPTVQSPLSIFLLFASRQPQLPLPILASDHMLFLAVPSSPLRDGLVSSCLACQSRPVKQPIPTALPEIWFVFDRSCFLQLFPNNSTFSRFNFSIHFRP